MSQHREPEKPIALSDLQAQCFEYYMQGMTYVDAYRRAKGLEGEITNTQRSAANAMFKSKAMQRKLAQVATNTGISLGITSDTVISLAMQGVKLALEERDEKGKLYGLANLAPLLKVIGRAAGCEVPSVADNDKGYTIIIESNNVEEKEVIEYTADKDSEIESIEVDTSNVVPLNKE